MSFTLPDLVIEGAVRKGFNFLRNNAGTSPTTPGGSDEVIGLGGQVLNMLFNFDTGNSSIDGGLDSSVSGKYSAEAFRLREFFRNNEVAIVQSFSDVQTHLPCISIQLANDGEDQGLALTDDFGGIDGTFDSNVPARDRLGRDENTIHANTVINVGIHTKEQLLTKYLYHIAKYFILSAKVELIRQNFIIATFRGSDFTRDASWQGDHVYTRFLNISGKTEDSWVNLDEVVEAIEDIDLRPFVGLSFTRESTFASRLISPAAMGSTTLQLLNSATFNTLTAFPYNRSLPFILATLITVDGNGKLIETLQNPLLPKSDTNKVIDRSVELVTITGIDAATNTVTISATTQVHGVALGSTKDDPNTNPPMKIAAPEDDRRSTLIVSSTAPTREILPVITGSWGLFQTGVNFVFNGLITGTDGDQVFSTGASNTFRIGAIPNGETFPITSVLDPLIAQGADISMTFTETVSNPAPSFSRDTVSITAIPAGMGSPDGYEIVLAGGSAPGFTVPTDGSANPNLIEFIFDTEIDLINDLTQFTVILNDVTGESGTFTSDITPSTRHSRETLAQVKVNNPTPTTSNNLSPAEIIYTDNSTSGGNTNPSPID